MKIVEGFWFATAVLFVIGNIAERALLSRILTSNLVWAHSMGFPRSAFAGYKMKEIGAYYAAILWLHPNLRTNRYDLALLLLAWCGLVPAAVLALITVSMMHPGR
jgi:hypothetical protein